MFLKLSFFPKKWQWMSFFHPIFYCRSQGVLQHTWFLSRAMAQQPIFPQRNNRNIDRYRYYLHGVSLKLILFPKQWQWMFYFPSILYWMVFFNPRNFRRKRHKNNGLLNRKTIGASIVTNINCMLYFWNLISFQGSDSERPAFSSIFYCDGIFQHL